MTRRMRRGSWRPVPSSVKIPTPASTNSPMGAMSVPSRRPSVMAAVGMISQVERRPSDLTCSTTATQSVVGSVLGMATRGRVPAQGTTPGTGLDRLGLLEARFTEMGMQVHEARVRPRSLLASRFHVAGDRPVPTAAIRGHRLADLDVERSAHPHCRLSVHLSAPGSSVGSLGSGVVPYGLGVHRPELAGLNPEGGTGRPYAPTRR